MALLADWIFLGHQAEGSYALADSRTSVFAAAIGGWLRIIVEGVQTQLVPQLFAVNGWRTDRLPVVRHTDIETPDLGKIGDYMVKLYGAGMQWDLEDPSLRDHLHKIANLPKRAARRSPASATSGRARSRTLHDGSGHYAHPRGHQVTAADMRQASPTCAPTCWPANSRRQAAPPDGAADAPAW
jgi:hypothetical protein